MMKQAILERKDGAFVIKNVKIPIPCRGEVLLKIKAATICSGTDLNIIKGIHAPHDLALKGMMPHDMRMYLSREKEKNCLEELYPQNIFPQKPYPTFMGHEAAGDVVKIGECTNNAPFEIGDRVSTVHIHGGYGEYSCATMNTLIKIPHSISYEEAALFEPLICVYSCMRKCVRAGDIVVILGQGGMGLLATQLAKLFGADKVITSEPLEHKRKMSIKLGADVSLDPNTTNVVHEIENLTNKEDVDVVLECAGVPETIKILPYVTKINGRIGQIGACGVPVKFDYGYIHFKHLSIYTSDIILPLFSIVPEIQWLIEMVGCKQIDLKSLITHKFSLDKINEAFEILKEGKDSVIKVAIIP